MATADSEAKPSSPTDLDVEAWIERGDLGLQLGQDDWWIELRVREGMPSRPHARPRQFKLSEVNAWLNDQGFEHT
jgi:hypothetical protein